MTQLNTLMAQYEIDPVLAAPSVVAVLLAVVAIWSFVRMRRALTVLPQMQERIDTLSHSMSLLTDTTESCFKALSMQLQFMQSQNVLRPSARPEAIVKTRRPAVKDRSKERAKVAAEKPLNGDAQAASIASAFLA